MKTINVVSVSGGKDSTATLLLAIERGVDNLQAVFADTDHEHPDVYEYLDYLETKTGIKIQRVKADFTEQINKRRKNLINFLHYISEDMTMKKGKGLTVDGWTMERLQKAIDILHPTGNAFLDLCLWKGRFPSTKVRFCTDELKVSPIQDQVYWPILRQGNTIESWQGIRWDESAARSKYVEREGIEPDAERVFAYRPILSWSAEDVFNYHRKHGVKWNPLYEKGMGRVGCMPCINCRKDELNEIGKRFPEEIARVAEMERIVSEASKRGSGTFFCAVTDPTVESDDDINHIDHGIYRALDWASTGRGGRQYDLLASDAPIPSCSSNYGLCDSGLKD